MAGRQHDLADGDAALAAQLHAGDVLDEPAGGGELLVDEHAGALLGSQPRVVHIAPSVHRSPNGTEPRGPPQAAC